MADRTLFHNPRCSKSRAAKQLLDEAGADYEVVEYLKAPPTRDRLVRIVELLEDPPVALVRTGEAGFKELGLTKADVTEAKAVVDLLVEHPELMERPVLLTDTAAVIGRPPERVNDLI